MDFRGFISQQQEGMRALASSGVIGLHLVSGPLVGFCLGYGADALFLLAPWGKLAGLFIGIGAGFLNVWRDTQALLRKIDNEDKSIKSQQGS